VSDVREVLKSARASGGAVVSRDAKAAADAGVVIVRDPDGHALQLARVGHSLAGK